MFNPRPPLNKKIHKKYKKQNKKQEKYTCIQWVEGWEGAGLTYHSLVNPQKFVFLFLLFAVCFVI